MADMSTNYHNRLMCYCAARRLGKVTRPYNPPTDLMERIRGIFEETFKDVKVDQPLQLQFPNRASKFHVSSVHV